MREERGTRPFAHCQSRKPSKLELRCLTAEGWEPLLCLMNTRKCETTSECKPTADVFHMQIYRIPEGLAVRTIWENVAMLKSRLVRQRSEAGCSRCPWGDAPSWWHHHPSLLPSGSCLSESLKAGTESLLLALTPSTFLILKFAPCSQMCFHL